MRPVDALSTEPILLGPVSHRVAGVETDPTGFTVEVAFTATAGEAPADWTPASWETVPTNSGTDSWWVRVLVGPLSELGALDPGDRRVRVRISVAGDERPVLDAGVITFV